MTMRKVLGAAAGGILLASQACPAGGQNVQGLLLKVDSASQTIMVSCEAVAGTMDAMVMPFTMHDRTVLKTLTPGTMVRFTMVARDHQEFAENLHVITFTGKEAEPIEAGNLSALHHALDPSSSIRAIAVGGEVPDFTLTDQANHQVSLSEFRGKVVALTFAYSRCPNPEYCFRLSNNLAQLSHRFHGRVSRDLALITIVIDPENDKDTALERYANIWKADPGTWSFLTGPLPEIQAIAERFGMNFWNDDGFLTHTLHTVILDREGRLKANVEGNEFTAKQLGDFVQTVISSGNGQKRISQ